MKLKDVSFWCIVLVMIIAMTFHHILSEKIIEGNSNIDNGLEFEMEIDTPPEIELKNKEIEKLKGKINFLEENMKK